LLNTRIYQILHSLERKKLNRFKKFINSPYFNINKGIIELGEMAVELIKEDKSPPSKEEIWAQLSTSKDTFDDLKYRKLCNELLERFERFLINEQLDGGKLMQANLLLDSIKANKLGTLFDKQIKKSQRIIDREIDQSAEYYLHVYFNKKILQNLKTNYEKKIDIKNSLSSLSYLDLSQNLDSFYVIEKLRHATDILAWRKLYKTDIELDLGLTLDIIDRYDLEKIPAVKVYHLMYKLMSGAGASEDYVELKEISEKVIDNFPSEEQREIIDTLLSFVIKDVNKGDQDALLEMVNLYEWGVDSEIILDQGFLSPTTFRNYVVGGLRLGLFEKVENFIKRNAILLEESVRENAINFNLSRLAFYRKDFNQVLVYLNKVNYDDIWYSVNSRTYLLAVYYEMKEYDVLESQIQSFTNFLRRDKSLDSNKTALYMNFISFVNKIFKVHGKASVEELRKEINEEKLVANKSWLLEKIDELL